MLHPDDYELVERLQKGDVEAFDMIYQKYSRKLYLFGLKYLRSAEEAEELVQSVFLKLWVNYRTLREDTSFKTFLFTIAYNDICKVFRKRNYQRKFIIDTLYENSQNVSELEESIDYQSAIERLQQIVNKLPERQKIIFLKKRNEGKSTKEIAKELGLSPGSIDNYMSESLKFIRKYLKKENLAIMPFFSMFIL